MPSSHVTCIYVLPVVGNQGHAALATRMAAVPLDLSLPRLWGLIPDQDTTTDLVTSVQRKIRLSMGLGTAPVTANMPVGGGSAIQSLTLGGVGGFFAGPPIINFDPAPSAAANTPLLEAAAVPVMNISQILVSAGGSGYNGPTTTAALVGGNLAPGGVAATVGVPIVIANKVTAVPLLTTGSGYTTYPVCVITDSSGAGSGALAYGALQIASLTLINPGNGYASAPTVVATPQYQAMNPIQSAGADGGPENTMAQWMSGVFRNQLRSPLQSQLTTVNT
jgi:hypothetical protein